MPIYVSGYTNYFNNKIQDVCINLGCDPLFQELGHGKNYSCPVYQLDCYIKNRIIISSNISYTYVSHTVTVVLSLVLSSIMRSNSFMGISLL